MPDDQTFRLLELIGIWLASIGTVGAVIVSLWLARRGDSIRLELSATHVLMITPGESATPEFLSIRVTNIGRRPARIEGIGWRSGLFRQGPYKSVHAIQKTDGWPGNSAVPSELRDGDVASFLIPAIRDGRSWYYEYMNVFTPTWIHRRTLRVLVWTSTGKMFRARPGASFFKALDEAAKMSPKAPG